MTNRLFSFFQRTVAYNGFVLSGHLNVLTQHAYCTNVRNASTDDYRYTLSGTKKLSFNLCGIQSLSLLPWSDTASERRELLENCHLAFKSHDPDEHMPDIFLDDDSSSTEGVKVVTICEPDKIENPGVLCLTATLPHHIDIEIQPSDLNFLEIGNFELNSVDLSSVGPCLIDCIKASRIDAVSAEEKIVANTLIGNVDLCAGKDIDVFKKVQGENLNCHSKTGGLYLESLYSSTSELSVNDGHIFCPSCHGNTTIHSKNGDITLGSVDGQIKILLGSGNINVHLSQFELATMEIAEKGNITLSLPERDVEYEIVIVINGIFQLVSYKAHEDAQPLELSQISEQNSVNLQEPKIRNLISKCRIVLATNEGTVTIKQESYMTRVMNRSRDWGIGFPLAGSTAASI